MKKCDKIFAQLNDHPDVFRFFHLLCTAVLLLVLLNTGPAAAQDESGSLPGEPYRPSLHFTPPANWLGGANSIIFDGEQYHLFYQTDPAAKAPGLGFWGHATSPDLINWQHQPLALYPDVLGEIEPGAVVVDVAGTAGFGEDAWVALFAQEREGERVLSAAVSTDRAQTWTMVPENPVSNLPDYFTAEPAPQVFWHERTGSWMMVLATGEDVWLYSSPNLLDWRKESEFGEGYGSHDGNWGAARLLQLPIDGGEEAAWVLAVSTGGGSPARTAGVQYFFGDFDGTTFTLAEDPETEHWVDGGADFWAPAVWQEPDGRFRWIAWLNNPSYATDTPTPSWRGSLTLPRELRLVSTEEGLALAQRPFTGLAALRRPLLTLADETVAPGTNLLDGLSGQAVEIVAEFDVSETAADSFGFRVRVGDEETTAVGYAPDRPGEAGNLEAFTIPNPGFESGDLSGWIIEGDAFADGDVSDATDWGWGCCFEQAGTFHLWGYNDGGDGQTGVLRSETFTLGGTGEVDFLIGGGNHPDELYVALVSAADGTELFRTTNTFWADNESLTRIFWDATDYLGEELYIKVVDNAQGGWGHINVDDFNIYKPRNVLFVDRATSGAVNFNNSFPARHNVALSPQDGRIKLHLFVDNSSIEVFGNDGLVAMSEQIFPGSDSVGLELFSDGDAVELVSLEVYELTAAQFADVALPDESVAALANPGFSDDLNGWAVSGNAFAATDGTAGSGADPALTGSLQSEAFILPAAGDGRVSFRIGGDADLNRLTVALVDANGRFLYRATGSGSTELRTVTWDASRFAGQPLTFRVTDASAGGSLIVDDFRITNAEGTAVTPAVWPLDESAETTATDTTSGIGDYVHYVFTDARYKPDSDPLWREGIKGNALLFDGYSTWIERAPEHFFQPVDQLTISAWVAPRSYEWGDLRQLSAIVNQHNKTRQEGFILGMYRHGSWSFQAGVGGTWVELWADEAHPLPRHEWSLITAVLNTPAGVMQLYLNGEMVGETAVPADAILTPSTESLLIGRHNQAAVIGGIFRANMFNGLIDELQILDEALPQEEIRAIYAADLEPYGGTPPAPDTAQKRSRYDGDRYRPQFHFLPPEHWMNEPHAPLHFNGQYHIFYQHNPQGPYWHQIHWGHAVSDDMVHWRDLPWALSPAANSVAPDGVWSGSATFAAGGSPVLFFTAGDDAHSPNQNTGVAFPVTAENPLAEWEMSPDLVPEQEPGLTVQIEQPNGTVTGEVWFGQFRDPHVWRETGPDGEPIWIQLVGSGVRLGAAAGVSNATPFGGTALVYTSTDLENWTYRGALMIGNALKYPWTGVVWELPVLLPLGTDSGGNEKHILAINPWFDGYSEYAVRNVYYWIGIWDRENFRFIPDQEEPLRFDYGDHYTGPTGTVDGNGRSILWSIAQDRRSEQAHYDAGWAHNAGLPLVLGLNEDDTLRIEPIPELASLRTEQLADVSNASINEANAQLENAGGDMLEIILSLTPADATRFGIKLRQSADGREETLLYYDNAAGTFSVDRSRSSLDPDARKGVQGDGLALPGGTLELHIFVDRSLVEAYANKRASITTRIYPTLPDAIGLEIWADGEVTVDRLQVWALDSAYGETVPAYYEEVAEVPAGQLPNHSFQSGDLTGWTEEGDAFSDEAVTDADDWGWGGPFYQAHDGTNGYHLWGAHAGDAPTGILRSEAFTLGGDGQIDFLVSGGNRIEDVYVALVRAADGENLMKATGHESEQYRRVHWDASAHLGEALYLEVVDRAMDGWGHINLDDVNVPTTGAADPVAAVEMAAEAKQVVEETAVSPTPEPVAEPAATTAPAPEAAPAADGSSSTLVAIILVIIVTIVAIAGGFLWRRRTA